MPGRPNPFTGGPCLLARAPNKCEGNRETLLSFGGQFATGACAARLESLFGETGEKYLTSYVTDAKFSLRNSGAASTPYLACT
jgi:hypothetical protein